VFSTQIREKGDIVGQGWGNLNPFPDPKQTAVVIKGSASLNEVREAAKTLVEILEAPNEQRTPEWHLALRQNLQRIRSLASQALG